MVLRALVDTGPLVALLDRSERAHASVRAAFAAHESAELITTEAVITEASDLLDFSVELQSALQVLLGSGHLRVEPMTTADRSRLAALIAKYRALPMDYADATLVLAAERLSITRILTLDRRDFGVYRVGRRVFQIYPR